MKPIKTAPDRKTLEAAFLILSLLPRRKMAVDTVKDAARKVTGMRMRILRETSYERRTADDGKRDAEQILACICVVGGARSAHQ